VRSIEEIQLVLAMINKGLNDCEIARRTGIPRGTIRGWRGGELPRIAKAEADTSCRHCGHPRHDFQDLPTPAYTYLLGLYLGDGSIARHPRAFRLTISLDRAYPGIVAECGRAMRRVMPGSKVGVLHRAHEETDEVNAYSTAWPCLFPQHGPGKKHLRKIELNAWQWQLIESDPRPLLRGLIHSDGCRSVNTIKHPKKTYVYPRYQFSNVSEDIKQIFCRSCDLLGIEWRVMNAKTISVARRKSVAFLDAFVGPKR
jgi:hypothetical protein